MVFNQSNRKELHAVGRLLREPAQLQEDLQEPGPRGLSQSRAVVLSRALSAGHSPPNPSLS